MTDIVEFEIKRYNNKQSANWNLGETIWSAVFKREDAEKKRKAIKRLVSMLEANEPDLYDLVPGDTLKIFKVKNVTNFNDMGEEIYSRDIKGCTRDQKAKKHLAARRLCRFLSDRDDEHWYAGRIETVGVGTYGYALTQRSSKVLSISDRELAIKRKISGRKAAITRNVNKAKAVRKEYRTSLFPDEYRSDSKYMRLLKYLPDQKRRLHEAKRMVPDDIESVEGGVLEGSMRSLERLLQEAV